MFKVKGVDCVDIAFGGVWLDFLHEFGCPMCNHCDGGREWCISMILAEEFIGLVGRVITLLGRGSD